jgi:hypothetical protein
MREIKFRGKPQNTLEIVPWVYGELITIKQDGHPTTFIHEPYELFDREPDDPYTEVIEGTVGQYTGLHDKSGKEIYEGDVLDGGDIIQWCDFGAAFVIGVGQTLYDIQADNACRVIGNIHDNKELLEGRA